MENLVYHGHYLIQEKNISYKKGICPIAEEYHAKSLIGFANCTLDFTDQDFINFEKAFDKVCSQIHLLKNSKKNMTGNKIKVLIVGFGQIGGQNTQDKLTKKTYRFSNHFKLLKHPKILNLLE